MKDLSTTQCIWEDNPRNITVLLSGYPQPSVSWARGDGRQVSPDESAYKLFFEPYWENGRADEWMANLQVSETTCETCTITVIDLPLSECYYLL